MGLYGLSDRAGNGTLRESQSQGHTWEGIWSFGAGTPPGGAEAAAGAVEDMAFNRQGLTDRGTAEAPRL